MNILDNAGKCLTVLVNPIIKLIDCISSGIGRVYEPTHIKRMAKAKAVEIDLVSKRMHENFNVPIIYQDGTVEIDTTKFNELVERTSYRLGFQEINKQINIENVIATAVNEFFSDETVTNKPVDQDWLTRFFNTVEDVSNEELQILWAKLLAGEIRKPGSYSMRTLEVLKNLTMCEAELFNRYCSFVINDSFIISNDKILSKYEIGFEDLILLNDCGLLDTSPFLSINYEVSGNEEIQLKTKTIIAFVSSKDNSIQKFSIPIYLLTNAGKEIYKVVNCSSNDEYFLDYFKEFKNENMIGVRAHKIIQIDDDQIVFDNYNLISEQ